MVNPKQDPKDIIYVAVLHNSVQLVNNLLTNGIKLHFTILKKQFTNIHRKQTTIHEHFSSRYEKG